MNAALGRPRAPLPSLSTARAGVALAGVFAALLAAYALLLAWPMRIWSRPVSPHTHLVGTLGVDKWGALAYAGIVLLLFALYAGALWLVLTRRARPAPLLVLGAAASFCLVLLPTHPLTSTDIFNYVASARIFWIHGENPLTTAPLAHADDPFFGLLSAWRDIPSPTGRSGRCLPACR